MDNKLLIEKLIDAAGKENVFTDNEHLIIYQRGSIDPLKHMPLAVVKITDEKIFPGS
ncbi:hypothetical protein [Acidiplasma cupricumulans]|uniref:hypothetical protein n=1 Tax=Acidiplasma cupricumulans TaxID=312540 RepID=UPI000A89C2EA|nr:hypothetical protein [Acidiplasma cupricumulans]